MLVVEEVEAPADCSRKFKHPIPTKIQPKSRNLHFSSSQGSGLSPALQLLHQMRDKSREDAHLGVIRKEDVENILMSRVELGVKKDKSGVAGPGRILDARTNYVKRLLPGLDEPFDPNRPLIRSKIYRAPRRLPPLHEPFDPTGLTRVQPDLSVTRSQPQSNWDKVCSAADESSGLELHESEDDNSIKEHRVLNETYVIETAKEPDESDDMTRDIPRWGSSQRRTRPSWPHDILSDSHPLMIPWEDMMSDDESVSTDASLARTATRTAGAGEEESDDEVQSQDGYQQWARHRLGWGLTGRGRRRQAPARQEYADRDDGYFYFGHDAIQNFMNPQ